VIVGATGSGKTNLMIRLWAGWYTAALDAFYAGTGNRPLLIVVDCKGGHDARKKAARTRRLLYGAGARNVAIWPDDARLSVWDLPAPDLVVLLYQMIETGTGNAAYYADILHAVTALAVTAPGGPPASAAAFLDRLDEHWLAAAWGDGAHPAQAARVRPPPATSVTSSSATPRCWTGSAAPSTAPASSLTLTPGTSSSKAPANPQWPKPRPWPSPN
jgi:hypothetical protein